MECGDCTLCCTLLPIKEMKSPAGKTCIACRNNKCNIYNTRPQECKDFKCLWLTSPVLGEDLRPDKCGVMFELCPEEKTVIALIARKNWKKENTKLLINQMLHDGYIVWIIDGKAKHLLLPEDVSEETAHANLKAAWRRKAWPLQAIPTI